MTGSLNKITVTIFPAYGDSDSTSLNSDDLLPPVQKLEKYADSDNMFNRYLELKICYSW